MKAIIKYVLNVFGLMFIIIGLTCNLSNIWESVFCGVGVLMYIVERQISVEDAEKQEKQKFMVYGVNLKEFKESYLN